MKRNKKLIGRGLMLLLPIVLLSVITLLYFQQKNNKTASETIATEEQLTPTPTILNTRPQSRWATDSTILEIQTDLKNLTEQVNKIDLKESSLLPPALDTNIQL